MSCCHFCLFFHQWCRAFCFFFVFFVVCSLLSIYLFTLILFRSSLLPSFLLDGIRCGSVDLICILVLISLLYKYRSIIGVDHISNKTQHQSGNNTCMFRYTWLIPYRNCKLLNTQTANRWLLLIPFLVTARFVTRSCWFVSNGISWLFVFSHCLSKLIKFYLQIESHSNWNSNTTDQIRTHTHYIIILKSNWYTRFRFHCFESTLITLSNGGWAVILLFSIFF